MVEEDADVVVVCDAVVDVDVVTSLISELFPHPVTKKAKQIDAAAISRRMQGPLVGSLMSCVE